MTNLHDQITAALAELRATAEAATPGPWQEQNGDVLTTETPPYEVAASDPHDGQHIAAWDPSTTLRWVGWAEDVTRRHALPHPDGDGHCAGCGYGPGEYVRHYWPCPEISGLAAALGLEEDTTHG